MNENMNKLIWESVPNQEKANEIIGKLFVVTQPGVVFSEPVVAGEHTLITASEITVAVGTGYGGGAGIGPTAGSEDDEAGHEGGSRGTGAGGGGGGGGTAMGRPVAVISVGPSGVRVEPIVDPTKIALAFFTAVGGMVMALRKMRRV